MKYKGSRLKWEVKNIILEENYMDVSVKLLIDGPNLKEIFPL